MSNKLKKTTALLLCVSILLVTAYAAVISQAYSADGFDFEIYYNEWVEIENYSGSEQTVIIPEKLGGLPVRNIGRNSFAGSNMTKVVFPETVRCIYAGAFDNCSYLCDVELNDGLESIYSCFKSTAIESISIPSSVDYLSATAFNGNTVLKEIVFEANYRCDITVLDADKAENGFSKNAVLKFNGIPSASLDITLRNMFYTLKTSDPAYIYEFTGYHGSGSGASLGEINIFGDYSYVETDDGVTIIECRDFKSNQIVVPSRIWGIKVTAIGEFAFSPISEIGKNKDDITVSDVQYSFTKITIPDSVKKIDRYACADNSCLEEAVLPDSLISLGYGAFNNCPNLTKVNIPNGIKTLEDNVFEKCALDSVNVPSNVSVICGNVFGISPDTAESDIFIPDTVEYMGNGVFTDYNLSQFTLPQNLKVLEGTFENQTELERVEFNDKIERIGENTFSQCGKIEEIAMPQSVTKLGSEAFYGCKNLKEIRLSSNLDTIGEAAFAECTSLDLVRWNPERKIILKDAFKNCPLRSFDFSNSNGVGAGAFKESKIEKVKIGESAQPEVKQSIGTMSFMSCEKLETAVIGGNISEIGSLAFANCENLEKVVIADSVERIAADAFDESENVTIYCLEDSYAEGFALSQSIKVTTLRIDSIPNQTYTSKEIKPALTVRFSSQTLSSGRDYKADYYNNLNVGTASVMVSGLGDYSMLMSKADFAIVARNISDADVIVTKQMTYNNEPCIPEVTVKFAGKTLSENKDYTVTLKNNNSVGTGTVRIKGIGNFKGTSDYNFEIREEEQSTAQKIIEAVITLWRRFISWIKTIFS